MADKSIDSVSKTIEVEDGQKAIYGQVSIIGESLVQDIIIVMEGGRMTENTLVLIENVWEDLISESGKWKSNEKKNYFYWPVTMTDVGNDDITHTVSYECPKPDLTIFPDPEKEQKTATSDWAKFWLQKMVDGIQNHQKEYTIQRKEILLKGTSWIGQDGSTKTIDDIKIQNSALGDIENLLSIF